MPKHKALLEKKGKNAWTKHKIQPTTGRTNDGVNRLHVHAADDSTNKHYIQAVFDFLRCVRKGALPFRIIKERDVALADYICDLCYSQDLPPSKSALVFADFNHIFPEHRGHMPEAARALQAWTKLDLGGEGGPLSEITIAAMI